MIRNVPNDKMFLHNEINSHNTTVNNNEIMIVNDVKIPNELKIEDLLPEERISYSLYYLILLYVIIYITISKTRMKYQNTLLVYYSK